MVAEIKFSKEFHHGKIRREFKICGIIELWIDDSYVRSRKFISKKQRTDIIELWYKISPALKNNYHYFIIKYTDE